MKGSNPYLKREANTSNSPCCPAHKQPLLSSIHGNSSEGEAKQERAEESSRSHVVQLTTPTLHHHYITDNDQPYTSGRERLLQVEPSALQPHNRVMSPGGSGHSTSGATQVGVVWFPWRYLHSEAGRLHWSQKLLRASCDSANVCVNVCAHMYVCIYVCVRDTERDRQTDRQTDKMGVAHLLRLQTRTLPSSPPDTSH